jgi:uncharacterized protein
LKIAAAGAALGAGLVGLIGLAYARKIEPARLEINEFEVRLPRLGKAFDGYRLVHISDIHMDEWMNARRLARIIQIVNSLQPDLVAITGDFVTHHPERHAPTLARIFRGLRAADGAGAVLGNHDHWSNDSIIRRMIRDAGLIDLNNNIHTIWRGEQALHIAGVDDYMEKMDRLDLVLEKLPEDGAAILLAHEPDFADRSGPTGRFDLQLSGHSHGGQVNLPVVGPPYLPRHSEKYPHGLYQVGEMQLYTNRGLGMVHLPLRWNSRPEITVFTLRSGDFLE